MINSAYTVVESISTCLIFVFIFFFSGCGTDTSYDSTSKVYIKNNGDYTIIRNNKPFHIQGVAGHYNLPLLRQIGGNTIRTYDTVGLTDILNEAQKNDLAVIAGLVLPKSTEDWFYESDSLISVYNQNLRSLAARHKDHPALLMWCLGNEPIFYDFTNFRFSKAYNKFLHTLRSADPDHPITMAMANFSDRAFLNTRLKIPDLDILMINTFGRLPKLKEDMNRYRLLWDGPYIIGEYGVSGPWETDRTAWHAPLEPNDEDKALRLKEMYKELPHDDPRFLGAIAFYWGYRQEVTHTWFNFFSNTREINQSVYALSELWGNPLNGNKPPSAKNLMIDKSADYNHLIFDSQTPHTAEVQVSDPENDSLSFEWSIRTEDWLFEKNKTPEPISNLFTSSGPHNSSVRFTAPDKPGPFRLFVKVSDNHGNFSVTNIPFYVVQ